MRDILGEWLVDTCVHVGLARRGSGSLDGSRAGSG